MENSCHKAWELKSCTQSLALYFAGDVFADSGQLGNQLIPSVNMVALLQMTILELMK